MTKKQNEIMERLAAEYFAKGWTKTPTTMQAFKAGFRAAHLRAEGLAKVGGRILKGLSEGIATVPGSYPHKQLIEALANYNGTESEGSGE